MVLSYIIYNITMRLLSLEDFGIPYGGAPLEESGSY
jgi:hypothetical protein